MRRKESVLLTGATSGIGLAIAKILCENGHTVFGLSRSGVCPTFSHNLYHLFAMDVCDDTSVEKTIPLVQQKAKELNLVGITTLIHCAGYGIAGSAEDTPIAKVKEQFETNYFGVLRVNSIALPLLDKSSPVKVIVLGSIAGRISIPYQSHYSSTKFALEAYIEALKIEGRQFNIQASIVEAGDTATPFTAHRTYEGDDDSPYTSIGKKAVAKMEKDEQNGYSPAVVAKVVYKVMERKNPPLRVAVGFSYKALMFLKRLLPDRFALWIITKLYL
jgi:short-subunit dehydrogenase